LPQDLLETAVGESDKPQHVLVLAEKGTRVPNVISSIPYYIPQPHDEEWEINLMILKSDKNLSNIEPTKGLNHKQVSAGSWIEHRLTELLFLLIAPWETLESQAWTPMAKVSLAAASTFSWSCEESNSSLMPLAVGTARRM
jgi:hypothetical protein